MTTPLNRISTSITHDVVASARSLVIADAVGDERYQDLMSVAKNRIRSLACVPLSTEYERIGAIYLDAGQRRDAFQDDQLPLLEAYADLAALAIRNLRRSRTIEQDRDHLRSDLKTQASVVMGHRMAAKAARARAGLSRMVGTSEALAEVRRAIQAAADTDASVLVTGESGTGKELVAHELHHGSSRRACPFITQSCANIQESLFESELFGHRRGAFTGAETDHPGLFVLAHQGTLFLDEIGELPLALQARLLRVLQEGRLRPVGGQEEVEVDVRLVTATNRDLRGMMEAGTFREDLYYRLRVIEISVPPLRDRTEDISELARYFLDQQRSGKRLSARAESALCAYSWPGNVRQLKNEMDRAAVLSREEVIDTGILSPEVFALGPESPTLVGFDGAPVSIKEAERRLISLALTHTRNDRTAAAALLGISRSTLYEKIKAHKEG